MTILFRCTKCSKVLEVAARKTGAKVHCPKCNHPLLVPAAAAKRDGPAVQARHPRPQRSHARDTEMAGGWRRAVVRGATTVAVGMLGLAVVSAVSLWLWYVVSQRANSHERLASVAIPPEIKEPAATHPTPQVEDEESDVADIQRIKGKTDHPRDKELVVPGPSGVPPPQIPAPVVRINLPLKALGSLDRLEKLKVVRLSAKASFAIATNVNDLTLTWCWDPKITIRLDEILPVDAQLRRINELLDNGNKADDAIVRRALDERAKAGCEFDAKRAEQYEREARILFNTRDLKPFFDTALLLDGEDGFKVFNGRLAIPLTAVRATQIRNLCLALSLSNLVPIKRHKFDVEAGEDVAVNERKCSQFAVKGPDGLKLQLFFDHETDLLAKIAHMGHDPRGIPGTGKQLFWEHYFSDYRETEGIMQWRKAIVHNDGQHFATINVTDVHFYDEMRPELRRPDRDDGP